MNYDFTGFPSWVENFVTYDIDRKQYIAWDETQAYEIGNGFDTCYDAARAVVRYAESIKIKDILNKYDLNGGKK